MSDYYDATGQPANRSKITSSTLRAEFAAIAAGLTSKLPALAGHGLELWRTNAGGTAAESVTFAALLATLTSLTLAGTLTGVTDLTTTGNTVLGNAAADTLNVGAGGLIKDASGNVGIGVSPLAKLHVLGGEVRLQTVAGMYSGYDTAGATRLGYLQFNASGAVLLASEGAAGQVAVRTNGATRMVIDAAGNAAPGVDATQALGASSLRWITTYTSAISDGAAATGLLLGSSGTTVRVGSGTSWTRAELWANNAARLIALATGEVMVARSSTFDAGYKFQVGDGVGDYRALFNSSGTFAIGLRNGGGTNGVFLLGASPAVSPDLLFSNTAGAEVFRMLSIGSFYGTSLHNGSDPMSGAAFHYVGSKTYSPVPVAVTNCSALSSPVVAKVKRVAGVVTVSGCVRLTAGAPGTVQFEIPLPIASSLADSRDVSGFSGVSGSGTSGGVVTVNTGTGRAVVVYVAPGAATVDVTYEFSYEVK